MYRYVRKVGIWGSRNAFVLLIGVFVLTLGTVLLKPGAAQADESCDKWKQVALSSVGLGQRLMAVEELKKVGSASALAALEDVARAGDLRIASAACAALGRVESSDSKDRLKALLEDKSLSTNLRISAASCIAEHWKDSGDKDDLESAAEGNDALAAHVEVLKSQVYEE